MKTPFCEVFLFLTDLAWKSRVTIPMLVTTVFLIMDIRLQIEINIQTGQVAAADLDEFEDSEDDEDDDDDDDDDDEDDNTNDDDSYDYIPDDVNDEDENGNIYTGHANGGLNTSDESSANRVRRLWV